MGVLLSEDLRSELEGVVRRATSQKRLVFRASIVLLVDEGMNFTQAGRALLTDRNTVAKWVGRFKASGVEGLAKDAQRPGKPRLIGPDMVKLILDLTRLTTPQGATHWSVRTLAEASGVSKATVQRIWADHGIKPHLIRSFKLSKDPRFEEKLVDVVGLYMDPPENALVLCVDEKTQCQALDRTQPGLPMKKGRCGTMTHDYKRHGTTNLFAALDTLTGKVIASCRPAHRHQEFLAFLKQVDRRTPKGLDLHLVLDNYATHKHPKVKEWLEGNPRFKLHFVPTSCSWLNLVERFFAQLTTKRLIRQRSGTAGCHS